MRKYLFLIAIFVLLGGCSSSEHLSLGEYDTIPKGTPIYDEEGRVIFTIQENFIITDKENSEIINNDGVVYVSFKYGNEAETCLYVKMEDITKCLTRKYVATKLLVEDNSGNLKPIDEDKIPWENVYIRQDGVMGIESDNLSEEGIFWLDEGNNVIYKGIEETVVLANEEKPTKTILNGIDISQFNKIDIGEMIKGGIEPPDFVIFRAVTQDKKTDPDDLAQKNFEYLKKSGIPGGFYMFVYNYADQDPVVQAKSAYTATKEYLNAGLIPIVDWEAVGNTNRVRTSDTEHLYAFLKAYEEASGKAPLVYMNQNAYNSGDYSQIIGNGNKLWFAKWNAEQVTADTNTKWGKASIVQTSNGGLEFKGCEKGIDEDIFFGTVEEFKKLAD